MDTRKILVWFRNDLRLHDNEMLVEAIAKSDSILPVYIFDPEFSGIEVSDGNNAGPFRQRFLLESVQALRESFQRFEGDLLIVSGKPEICIPELVEQYDIAEVYHHREVSNKETTDSSLVEDHLWKLKVNLRHFIGHTLYNKEDLPFPIKDIPDVFSQFKKKTERDAMVKDCLAVPEKISFVKVENWGEMPVIPACPEGVLHGGEAAGITQLEEMLRADSPVHAKINRSQAGKSDFSTQLSPYLATGCLSPRKVYWAIKDTLQGKAASPVLNAILQGLLLRDFFRFMLKKHGVNFYTEKLEHLQAESDPQVYVQLLENWRNGNTGHEIVDGFMQNLNKSGQISNAGRILVATYLVHVLKISWIEGVLYFEQKLLDYSPASNWGNWANIASGAVEPKTKSLYDLDKQLKMLNLEAQV